MEATLKYNDDCGWYAVVNGKILDDGSGIDGTYAQAFDRLAAVMDANRESMEDVPGSWEYRQ